MISKYTKKYDVKFNYNYFVEIWMKCAEMCIFSWYNITNKYFYVYRGDILNKKFWKLKNSFDRQNIRKQLKNKRRKNRIRIGKIKSKLNSIDKKYINDYSFLINFNQIKLDKYYNKEYEIVCPSIFSLKDNFNTSISFISHIASLACNKIYSSIKLIHLNFKKTIIYDLDASCILDSIMSRLKYILKTHNVDFKVSFPENMNSIAYKNIITTGFVNEKGWHSARKPTSEIREKLKREQNVRFVDFNKNNIENYDIITTEIVEMIFSNFRNKEKYIVSMGKIISEIVDNVHEHSDNSSWYIVGNVIPKDEYSNSSIRLAIMNYGTVISDTLKSFMNNDNNLLTEKQQKIMDASKEIIKKHKMFFNNDFYEEEQAYTFLAIQQGISSKIQDSNNSNKRGSGIYKLNNEINKIASKVDLEKANCTIISGNTMIKFKNKYIYKLNNEIDDNLYQICFNKENTILKQQDNDCILILPKKFPGTILYLDFNFKEELVNE